jgi:hypothetical protein
MFGRKKKQLNNMVNELLEIVGTNHENVSIMQEALGHLGEAVTNMHKLVMILESRIELLEAERPVRLDD